MKKEIKTAKAPSGIGPFSQAIESNGFIFASGQIAVDPDTGKLIEGDIRDQTRRALSNLKAVLEEAGSSLEKVVKCTVFLQNLEDYHGMNAVYQEAFRSPFPARLAVQAARLPLDARVEIEAIAVR